MFFIDALKAHMKRNQILQDIEAEKKRFVNETMTMKSASMNMESYLIAMEDVVVKYKIVSIDGDVLMFENPCAARDLVESVKTLLAFFVEFPNTLNHMREASSQDNKNNVGYSDNIINVVDIITKFSSNGDLTFSSAKTVAAYINTVVMKKRKNAALSQNLEYDGLSDIDE